MSRQKRIADTEKHSKKDYDDHKYVNMLQEKMGTLAENVLVALFFVGWFPYHDSVEIYFAQYIANNK